MTERTGVWLEDLTWQEAKARFDAGAVMVIPVGAASKAHGPHLPLKTNALIARALAQKLIERLPVVAAPVVGFGCSKALMRELIDDCRAQGVRRIAVVSAGVESAKLLGDVAGEVVVLSGNAEGGSADEHDTSIMLALEPRSVRMDRLTPDGQRASAFKGERLMDARAEEMAEAIVRRWPEAF